MGKVLPGVKQLAQAGTAGKRTSWQAASQAGTAGPSGNSRRAAKMGKVLPGVKQLAQAGVKQLAQVLPSGCEAGAKMGKVLPGVKQLAQAGTAGEPQKWAKFCLV